ncbi:MAG: glycine--tRNA ligase subunit beta, partial [Acidobacteriota bacterium]
MAELLVEVRFQELPAELVPSFLRRFAGRIFEDLMSHGIPMDEMRTGGTVRRVAVSVTGLPDREADHEEVEIGPAVAEAWDDAGEPTSTLLDFAARVERDPDTLERQRTERGEMVIVRRPVAGRRIAEVLAERLGRLLPDMPRASDGAIGDEAWPRPLTGWLAMVDGDPLDLELGGLIVERTTVAHPTLAPQPFEVAGWDDYIRGLTERGVVVGVKERVAALASALDAAAASVGGARAGTPRLVERSAAACEIPGALAGAFDPAALDLPSEMVQAALAERQQAFPVVGDDGQPMPFFVAAIDRPDDPTGRIRRGRERAVAGVLDDLRFFVESDRRQPLAQRVRRLEQVTFHPGLGTYAEKGKRVARLAELVCGQLGWDAAAEAAFEATTLLDADLTTAVVAAYPSLRGLVGGLYAREEGYVETVWRAIRDHVLPVGDGPIPSGRTSLAVALADRLDTLVGLLGVDDESAVVDDQRSPKPLATGLLRLVVEGGMVLDLDLLAARAVLLYGDRLARGSEELLRDLQALLDERLDHLLGQRDYAPDEIEATKAVGTRDLPDLIARI